MHSKKFFQGGLILSVVTAACLLGAAAYADSPGGDSSPGPVVSFHGFISTTAFWQDQDFTFGNGQNGEWPVPNTGPKHNLSGMDARSTRAWLDVTGARLGDGWSAGAHLEADFFGGFNGTGAYSAQQETPRLRQAFMKLSNAESGSSISIGQQLNLLFPADALPTSLAHVAFPLGFGTGLIGWRFPGVVYSQNLGAATADTIAWRLDLGAFSGSWNGPGSTTNFDTAANVDFRPQLEARLHAQQGNWSGFLAGHYSSEDLTGVGGNAPAPITNKINSTAVEIGTAWHPGPWSLVAAAYTGKGLGPLWGALTQFGAISEHGGYVQGGYKFTPNWGLYAFYASARPDKTDVINWIGQGSSGLLKNQQYALDLIYTRGPFGFGAEWLHSNLESTTAASAPASITTVGNQFSLSAMFNF